MIKKRNIILKFNTLLAITFGIFLHPLTDGNAFNLPLWSETVCDLALKQCRQNQNVSANYGAEVCENFNKEIQPYLRAGSDKDTGLEACREIIKTIPKEERNPTDPKTDPCAAGYTICKQSASQN